MGPTLATAVRSELCKFFTTRLWWGMAIAGRAQRRLPADAGARRPRDRPGVPAQDHHLDLPGGPAPRSRAMLGKVAALFVIAAAYGLLSLVGSVSVGALVLNLRGTEAFPSTRCCGPSPSACWSSASGR